MIKRSIIAVALCLWMGNAKAQLSGTIPGIADSVWTIQGNDLPPIAITMDKSGNFNISIKGLTPGVYEFGKVGLIYLEPDYKLKISEQGKKYQFTGDGKLENDALRNMNSQLNQFLGNPGYDVWHRYLLTEPKIFIPILNGYVEKSNAAANKSNSELFKSFVKQESELDKRHCLYAYNRFYGLDSTKMGALREILVMPKADRKENYRERLSAAHQAQFSKKLSPAEKDAIEKSIYHDLDMNNEMLYRNSKHYKDLLSSKIDYLAYGKKYDNIRDSIQNDDKVKLILLDSLITSTYIKARFAYRFTLSAIKKAKKPEDVSDVYQSFLNTANDEKQTAEIKTAYQNLSETLANKSAPDFKYENLQSQLVSLKDFKGNYVYIDIWATWCGPCIAEIPSLKKLEKRFEGKKIKFVSISVDVSAHKQKWADFVKNNNLGGVQLLADKDFNSQFIKTFGITTIPRFILIDPEGKIIDNNAKRPSDEKLSTQLNTFKM